MNKRTKSIIIDGLIGGIVYAAIMARFDYFDGKEFRNHHGISCFFVDL